MSQPVFRSRPPADTRGDPRRACGKCGFPVEERLYEQESYYCPHVSPADYADGWYDKLDAMQGKQNTWYAGEIISFGDMEDTCAASKDLVERFF